jgi:uncharacterized protein (TIGR02271 family)
MTTETTSPSWLDATVVGSDGDEIGQVSQVYADNKTGEPSWVTVRTGWFGLGESFIPLSSATLQGDRIAVPYDKDTIKGAPKFESDEPLSSADENELYRYYGLGDSDSADWDTTTTTTETTGGDQSSYGYSATDTQATGDQVTTDRTSDYTSTSGQLEGDNSMVLSEEKLHVGTEKVETGRARLRKYVVTENQTVTLPVSREEVRVVREPISADDADAYRGKDITEADHEVTLTEERLVVNKEAVPVERVALDKETVTENQQVTEEVRKEQVEFDDGTSRGTDIRGDEGTRRV